MARDVQLIEHYERRERDALIVVHEKRHLVTHSTARSFLQEILTDWWNRQLAQQTYAAGNKNPQSPGAIQ